MVSMGIWGAQINYRTGSESARNRDPEEYESTVFYGTFVLLIPFYNCGNSYSYIINYIVDMIIITLSLLVISLLLIDYHDNHDLN